jgi:hypothetical protein
MTDPDSGFPETGGGWNNGRICFMFGYQLDWLQSRSRHCRSSRSFPILRGLQHSEILEENILASCWRKSGELYLCEASGNGFE